MPVLPPGLTLNRATGRVSGTPTKVGTWSKLTITVTDSKRRTASFKGELAVLAPGEYGKAVSVGATGERTCAVNDRGAVYCWGLGYYFGPVLVNETANARSISVGRGHTCVVTRAGAALCSGSNLDGQLGTGDTASRKVLSPVTGLDTGVSAISVGSEHTCALMVAGTVKCWGANAGRLDGGFAESVLPVDVPGLSGVTAIASGTDYTCALRSAGTVHCWGVDLYGALGLGQKSGEDEPVMSADTPAQVHSLTGAVAIAAGDSTSCAVLASGAARCWGLNAEGQLGDGTTVDRSTPVAVSGLTSVVAMGVGGEITRGSHTCAILTGGGVRCWGSNSHGQLGDNTYVDRSVPVAVRGLSSGASALAPGALHTCALMAGGSVRCWGNNGDGELGDLSGQDSKVPVDVYGFG
jgi:alpha-tubulin suppressor-like RCC1 family protein